MRRAKSTVVGVETTSGELLTPFRVMELMVTSKPTTEGRGASSPVTKTLPGCAPVVRVFELPEQPSAMAASSAAKVKARNLFIANSRVRNCYRTSSRLTHMETRALEECRVTIRCVTGKNSPGTTATIALFLNELAAQLREMAVGAWTSG